MERRTGFGLRRASLERCVFTETAEIVDRSSERVPGLTHIGDFLGSGIATDF